MKACTKLDGLLHIGIGYRDGTNNGSKQQFTEC